MKTLNCPSCGAEVHFQSNLSVYAVCAYCSSMVVRHDVDVEAIGKMAALPEDMSPLQLGTEGSYKGLHFGIIGRLKIGWEDGAWNEWFLLTDDGRKGWLAEAQGSYSVAFELDDALHPNTSNALANSVERFKDRTAKEQTNKAMGKDAIRTELGSVLTLAGKRFKVVDIKHTTCLGSEGELPFTAPKGRATISVDLSSEDGAFANIETCEGKQRIYIGEYVEWNDLKCQNLRPLEGW